MGLSAAQAVVCMSLAITPCMVGRHVCRTFGLHALPGLLLCLHCLQEETFVGVLLVQHLLADPCWLILAAQTRPGHQCLQASLTWSIEQAVQARSRLAALRSPSSEQPALHPLVHVQG